MRKLTTRITPFQRIEVWGDSHEVEFRVTGATHAWWHRQRFLTGLAWDNMAAGVLSHPGKPRSLLMLGLGGGTSLRTLRHLVPGLDITAVEIDADMVALAREYMDLDAIGAKVITGDAYAWLERNRRKFDIVFDDVYGVSHEDVIRPGIYTPALRAALDRSMAPGGLFAVNLVIGKGHRRMQTAFRSFFREHFPAVRSITTPASLNETLTGGPALREWRELWEWKHQFPFPEDRRYWEALRGRRMK
jgi:Spermine/spermidine synthase domain